MSGRRNGGWRPRFWWNASKTLCDGVISACFSIGPLLIVGVLYCVGVGLGGTREGAVMADWVVNLPPVADVLETGFLFGPAR